MLTRLIDDLIDAASSNLNELLVSPFYFNIKSNELLFFFKPECFLVDNAGYTRSIFEMTLQKFDQYDVQISGALLLRGERLRELGIMDRHYGFINKLSRSASKLLTNEDRIKIQHSLEMASIEKYKLLGGHEFLQEFDEFDDDSLNELWATKKSIKLRSGFYVQKYTVHEENIVLVNGFHPVQLSHFTKPSHRIIVLLLHSDRDWKELKNDLVGNTFPEKAKPISIRGELFKHSHKYGIHTVSISNNCTHLSAGPFEALFEINNFLMNVGAIGYEPSKTNMFRLMIKRRLRQEDVERCLLNPTIEINGKQTDLYTFTEDKNSSEAISDYVKCFFGN